jgi:hypothetical protein
MWLLCELFDTWNQTCGEGENGMFLEDVDGDLINTADIVMIEQKGGAVQARLRDDRVCTLMHEMLDIKRLLENVMPAAPGFYVVNFGGSREPHETHAVIGWRRANYGWDPVVQSVEVNNAMNDSDYCVIFPNGQVLGARDFTVFRNVAEWRQNEIDVERIQQAKAERES